MLNKRLEDLHVIENHRQEIIARRGGKPLDIDAAQVINEIRNERTNELVASVFPRAKDVPQTKDSDRVLPSSL